MTDNAVAVDAIPPKLLIRVMNPVLRSLLRTPAGRLVRPFALLEFDGRRSGRRFQVPVGWHEVHGEPAVFTPAPWRANFRAGCDVTVWYRGRQQRFVGTLDDDPTRVATALQELAERRGSLRSVGIRMPHGRPVTVADAKAVDRALIRFARMPSVRW